jgi:hypothetical protein
MLCALSRGRNVLGHVLRLLHVSADDASVRAERNHRAHLSGADCACAAGAEDDLVLWEVLDGPSLEHGVHTEDVISPDVAHILVLLLRHGGRR